MQVENQSVKYHRLSWMIDPVIVCALVGFLLVGIGLFSYEDHEIRFRTSRKSLSNEICDTSCDTFKVKILAPFVVQALAVILLVTLAFPQNDRSRKVFDGSFSTTTPTTTTNCPCIATSEYNPVCGTDNVTYWNMGRFNCAKNCNPQLEVRLIRACEPYIQLSSN
ncbi:hypothetical protein HN011_009980 [Eciton burchellii]|nr:hypothetical protein HN011_009980 [Eciton burchellii]